MARKRKDNAEARRVAESFARAPMGLACWARLSMRRLGDFVGNGAFLTGGKFFGLGFDAFEHSAENEVVKG